MCMLTYIPADTEPDVARLMNGAIANNDGHGFAIVADKELIVRHGMHPEQVISEFESEREFFKGPALFHSRYATHGTTDLANCHPFNVSGDRRTVIAHNGILPADSQPESGDNRSDTRIMADELAKRFDAGRTSRARRRLGKWMGKWNKVVILTVDHRYSRSAFIVNEDQGIWDAGIWYSNGGYKPSIRNRWAFEPECLVCSYPLTDGICEACETCQDCYETWDECVCVCYPATDSKGNIRSRYDEGTLSARYREWWLENATP